MSGKGGKERKHPGVKGLSPHLKEMRQREAHARNSKWENLPLSEQLEVLETKFPTGANRQKARIAARIEAAKNAPLATPEAKKDRIEEDKKLSSREKKQEEMKAARLRTDGTTLGDVS